MINNNRLNQAKRAAIIYLEMRGFTLVEQNYSRSSGKVDLIVTKENIAYFILIYYQEGFNAPLNDLPPVVNDTLANKLTITAEYWQKETAWNNKITFSSIIIAGSSYSIISFNNNII